MPIRLVPSLILPTAWVTGAETELIDDLLEHISYEYPVTEIQEKIIMVLASEVVVVGVPGNLNLWIELSPVLSTTSAAYWAAIGGGGGALAPVAPMVEVATGVNGTVHTIMLAWAIHSPFARVVVQTPVAATPATAFWAVQALEMGKGFR